MRTSVLLRQNIDALLRARGQSRHDLAAWCRRTDAWLSKIMDVNGQRGLPLKYLDRIADFFGIATYQLLQPGITPLMERRKGDRRTGSDRRISNAQRLLRDPADDKNELIRLVLATSGEDRRNLYAQLVSLRNGVPSTAATDAAPAPSDRTASATRHGRRR